MRLREAVVIVSLLAAAQGPALAQAPTEASAPRERVEAVFVPAAAASSASLPASAVAEAASAPASGPILFPGDKVTLNAVRTATQLVKADPLLPGPEKIRVLQLKKDKPKKKDEPKKKEDDPNWWVELFSSLSTGLRVVVWIVGAGLLIWVLLHVREWVLARRGEGRLVAAVAPTHVGSLDIRPESLPDDIGAAARALWQRGELRGALSLLYRGALSRLVHSYRVPIRAASTESDCVALAAQHLAPASQEFLARLVGSWQMVAYARRELSPEVFEELCGNFDARLTRGGTA